MADSALVTSWGCILSGCQWGLLLQGPPPSEGCTLLWACWRTRCPRVWEPLNQMSLLSAKAFPRWLSSRSSWGNEKCPLHLVPRGRESRSGCGTSATSVSSLPLCSRSLGEVCSRLPSRPLFSTLFSIRCIGLSVVSQEQGDTGGEQLSGRPWAAGWMLR